MTDQPPPLTPPEPAPEVTAPPVAPVPPITPPVAYAPPSYPPPQYAPPTYAQQYPSPQYGVTYPPAYPHFSPPPRKPMTRRTRVLMIVGIVAGSSLLLGGVIVGGTALGNTFARPAFDPTILDPQAGDPTVGIPGPPGPALTCPEDCFIASDAEEMHPSHADLTALGTEYPLGGYAFGNWETIVSEYPYAVSGWEEINASPDRCFFTFPAAPISEALGDPPRISNGEIMYTAGYESLGSSSAWTQSVRTFTTSDQAVQHLATIESLVGGCAHYTSDEWDADVRFAPPVTLPAGVTSAGWIEQSEYGSYLVYDLARGNMVVRNMFSTGSESDVARFISFVERQAALLAGLTSWDRGTYTPPEGCTIACLSAGQAASLALDAAIVSPLGALDAAPSVPLAATLGDASNAALTVYTTGNGDPYNCYFGLSRTPINPLQDIFTQRDAATIDLGTWADATTSVTQSALTFDFELYASRHPGFLNSPIKQCAEYSYEADGVLHEVTIAGKTFDTGDVVSAGWIETEGSTTRTFADLQYRNILVRIIVERTAGSAVTDAQVAAYIASEAERLAALAG